MPNVTRKTNLFPFVLIAVACSCLIVLALALVVGVVMIRDGRREEAATAAAGRREEAATAAAEDRSREISSLEEYYLAGHRRKVAYKVELEFKSFAIFNDAKGFLSLDASSIAMKLDEEYRQKLADHVKIYSVNYKKLIELDPDRLVKLETHERDS